jgi:hypothetical protein
MTPEVRGLFQGDDGRPPEPAHRRHGTSQHDLCNHDNEHNALVIDCDRCAMRGVGCDDCVVSVLLGGPPQGDALDETEVHAIDVLADAGLVPPLRMSERAVESRPSRSIESA